eukprot:3278252-Pyramimonas_sp.AAC.1
MKAYAHIAERTPGNTGGASKHGHRTDVFHSDTHAGRPVSTIWNNDPQPNEAPLYQANRVPSPRGRKTP